MATQSGILLLADLATGESGVLGYANWGEAADDNWAKLEDTIGEVTSKTLSGANVTLTAQEERSLLVDLDGTLSANVSVQTNDRKGFWFVRNGTSGSYAVTFKTASGSGITIPQGGWAIAVSDGTDIHAVMSMSVAGQSLASSASADAQRAALAAAPLPGYSAKSANYTAVATDAGKAIEFTANATLSLTAAATLGSGWSAVVQANGGTVTIDPNGAETIDGAATLTLYTGSAALVYCTGSAFQSITLPTTASLANMRVLGNVSGATAAPSAVTIIDDDTMATATATNLATAESVKAYIDGALPGANIVAWANFDGSGTPSIRAGYNVASVNDNGTGDFTLNFTDALTDTNYAVFGIAMRASTTDQRQQVFVITNSSGVPVTKTTGAVRIGVMTVSATFIDPTECYVVIVR